MLVSNGSEMWTVVLNYHTTRWPIDVERKEKFRVVKISHHPMTNGCGKERKV